MFPTASYCGTVFVVLMFLDFTRSSEYHKDDWVDPDDIMNYDRASKTMLRGDKARKRQDDWVEPDSPHDGPPRSVNNCYSDEHAKEVLDFKEKLSRCENLLMKQENCKPTPVDITAKTKPPTVRASLIRTSEMVFMKRFVGIVLETSGLGRLRLAPGETRHVSVEVVVTEEQLVIMQQFGSNNDDTTLGQLDDVLSNVFRSSESGFYVPLGWLEWFTMFFSDTDVWYRVTPYAFTLVVVLMILFQRPTYEIVTTFLLLVFAGSYQLTYEYLIKMAEIEQYVTMAQLNDVPSNCRPIESIFDYVKQKFLGSEADCRKYHVAQMMAPALIVTPTIVLSEMLAAMLIHPMGMFGSGIAAFSAGMLDGLSFLQGIIVLPLVFYLGLVLLCVVGTVVLGGRLRLPIWMGGFELIGNTARHVYDRQRVQELSAPSYPNPALPSPNPVNVNIYLDGARFATPREAVQQLAPLTNTVQQTPDVVRSDTGIKVDRAAGDIEKTIGAVESTRSTEAVPSITFTDVCQVSSERISQESLDQSRSGFLETIEKILREPVGTDGDVAAGAEADMTVNTEFITSIERILLESSVDESDSNTVGSDSVYQGGVDAAMSDLAALCLDGKNAAGDSGEANPSQTARKGSEDSSDGSGDFVKL